MYFINLELCIIYQKFCVSGTIFSPNASIILSYIYLYFDAKQHVNLSQFAEDFFFSYWSQLMWIILRHLGSCHMSKFLFFLRSCWIKLLAGLADELAECSTRPWLWKWQKILKGIFVLYLIGASYADEHLILKLYLCY